ncbi:MAG: histone deacetylase family protein [Spirochaetota bacterium]
MKLVFDERFRTASYADDNASMPGRIDAAMSGIDSRRWGLVAPSPATVEQLCLAHDRAYVERISGQEALFSMASLAAGASILAADIAFGGEPAFACLRPPGHHASRGSAWGYCVFNNIAIALLALKAAGSIESAFVIDIDQHTGDGTRNILADWKDAEAFNPYEEDAGAYVRLVEARLASLREVSIIGVSAGFDGYLLDVGHKLSTSDFREIAALIRDASRRVSGGRRFAVLEGGYYLPDFGANLRAFCEGFE